MSAADDDEFFVNLLENVLENNLTELSDRFRPVVESIMAARKGGKFVSLRLSTKRHIQKTTKNKKPKKVKNCGRGREALHPEMDFK